MALKDAFYTEEKKPMMTVQKSINRRPHIASKFYKKVAKKFKTGRKPPDIRPRFKEPVPPFHEQAGQGHHFQYDKKK